MPTPRCSVPRPKGATSVRSSSRTWEGKRFAVFPPGKTDVVDVADRIRLRCQPAELLLAPARGATRKYSRPALRLLPTGHSAMSRFALVRRRTDPFARGEYCPASGDIRKDTRS